MKGPNKPFWNWTEICIQIWINQLLILIEKLSPLPGFGIWTSDLPCTKPMRYQLSYPGLELKIIHRQFRVFSIHEHNNNDEILINYELWSIKQLNIQNLVTKVQHLNKVVLSTSFTTAVYY